MPGLADFKDKHRGETIIVCGCGESLRELTHPEQYITIGVNDVGRLFHPDYLVVVNPRRQFSKDRFRFVETSQAKYLFTQLDLGISNRNIVKFQLGTYGGTNGSVPNVLHYTRNSPYVAICLALHVGAKRIGLIGVDFTDNHFYGQTGRHSLTAQLQEIDKEYGALARACRERGVELFNLSPISRLTSIPRTGIDQFASSASGPAKQMQEEKKHRIFFVHYRFLSCGDIFFTGLRNAADELGLVHEHAWWDDRTLPQKVQAFKPELLFVVHGRRFAQTWGNRFRDLNTAVWLVDEPYETDDTARWSPHFNTVFVNDPATIPRHRNARYLPVCYDPRLHRNGVHDRKYKAGFIGGHNETRERALAALAREGLLSYVAGGPWRDPVLQKISKGATVSPEQVAELYRQTAVVVNVFRDTHQYNRSRIAAWSMNPRIYEALACGAFLVSEIRPEIQAVFPEMPTFERPAEMVSLVGDVLAHAEKYEAARQACHARLSGHTYRNRLKEIISIACNGTTINRMTKEDAMQAAAQTVHAVPNTEMPTAGQADWEEFGNVVRRTSDGEFELRKEHDGAPGAERGLVSKKPYARIELDFEVNIDPEACFIAKIRQSDKYDQLSNSYHMLCNGSRDYFARHDHIYRTFALKRNSWEKIRLVANNGTIAAYQNENLLFSIQDRTLESGHAFIGIKGGRALVRNIRLNETENGIHTLVKRVFDAEDHDLLLEAPLAETPLVSIITTVYDRTECLKDCIQSVKKLNFQNFEQIIVADCPPEESMHKIKDIIREENTGRITLINLRTRYNNWGIQPAAVGLRFSRGKYICFLSDDNGYTPDHFDHLVPVLEREPGIGFVYSSCNYAGRGRLNHPRPAPGRIDLGQPLFRSNLFHTYLQGTLPFNEFAWDWRMIESFIQKGVKWRHVERASFLFRLASCHRMAGV